MDNGKRQVSQRSLDNLKLGASARYKGKLRINFSLLPETAEWLRQQDNASETIDRLVANAKSSFEKEAIQAEVERLRAQLNQLSQELAILEEKIN